MSKNKIWKDEVEIHDWDTWCEYYEDTDNNLDDGTWYEIYMSGYGRGQQVTKKMIMKDMIEKFEIDGLQEKYSLDNYGDNTPNRIDDFIGEVNREISEYGGDRGDRIQRYFIGCIQELLSECNNKWEVE